MKNKQLMFFSLYQDIVPLLKDIENVVDIQYFKTGLYDNKDIIKCSSVVNIKNVGFVHSGDWNRIDNYLVMKKSIPLIIREIPQRDGTIKFAIDQMSNLLSIELKLGGIYSEKGDVIVAGRIATISGVDESIDLYKLFTSKFKKKFKKISEFYVSVSAEERLKQGWRLVTNEKLSKEYDLQE